MLLTPSHAPRNAPCLRGALPCAAQDQWRRRALLHTRPSAALHTTVSRFTREQGSHVLLVFSMHAVHPDGEVALLGRVPLPVPPHSRFERQL